MNLFYRASKLLKWNEQMWKSIWFWKWTSNSKINKIPLFQIKIHFNNYVNRFKATTTRDKNPWEREKSQYKVCKNKRICKIIFYWRKTMCPPTTWKLTQKTIISFKGFCFLGFFFKIYCKSLTIEISSVLQT